MTLTLERGNAYRDAPASLLSTLERRRMHSHAGAWERENAQPSRFWQLRAGTLNLEGFLVAMT